MAQNHVKVNPAMPLEANPKSIEQCVNVGGYFAESVVMLQSCFAIDVIV